MTREQRSRSVESAIDDAVARAGGGESRCACGCGAVLCADGPSAWFAHAGCQKRWQARDATRPGEVWSRPDAAQVFREHDSMPIPLTGDEPVAVLAAQAREALANMSLRVAAAEARLATSGGEALAMVLSGMMSVESIRAAFGLPEYTMPSAPRLVEVPAPQPEPAWTTSHRDPAPPLPEDLPARLRYTRWCVRCRKRQVPRLVTVVVPSPALYAWELFADEVVATHETRLAHGCPACSKPFDGPALWSVVGRAPEPWWCWELMLSDDPDAERMPMMRLSYEAGGYSELAEVAWQDMERALAVARRPACATPGCDEPARAVRRFGCSAGN